MQYNLDEDRALLKQSTRELLESESPLTDARAIMEDSSEGYDKALYANLAELGYMGLAVPEEEGGSGVGAIGLVAVLEELGRAAFPGPFLDMAMAAEVLRGVKEPEGAEWLRRLVAGEALVLIANSESLSGDEPIEPNTHFDDGRVTGSKHFVPFGAQADAMLVSTDAGLVVVPKPDAGWNADLLEALDHAQRLASIDFDASCTQLTDSGTAATLLESAHQLGALGAAALMLGLMERTLEMTLSYTMERQAFGAPIATFQVLQHRQADMFIHTESTRAAVYRAAWAADHDPDSASRLIAVAKAAAGDAGRWVAGQSIQLHGGVGYTWEYDPHIYLKRIKTLEQFYGTTRSQLEKVLQAARI